MRNKSAILTAVAAVAMIVAQQAHAQQAGTVGELSAVQTETLLIKAKAARAAAQAELDKSRPVPVMVVRPQRGGAMEEDMGEPAVNMRVTGVHGVGGKRQASVVLGDGTARTVGVGETVGGVKIVKVGIDEVIVSARGRESTIPVIMQSPQQPQRSAGAPLPGMPGIN